MSKRKKSNKDKGIKLTAPRLKSEILRLFKRHPKQKLNPRQIAKKLKVTNSKDSIQYALQTLVEERHVMVLDNYQYKFRPRAMGRPEKTMHEGIVDMTKTGSAYIIVDDLDDDVHVAASNLNTAMHRDRVQLRVWLPRGRRRAEGEVVQVLERKTQHFMGTLYLQPKHAMILADGKAPVEIVAQLEDIQNAQDNDKVVIRVDKWLDGRYGRPSGKVTAVLGAAGTSDIEMKAILISNGFDLNFSDAAMSESEALPEVIPASEILKRRDFRPITTFTIDPETAKDFDDALSLEYLENGNCEVGVHIADVTHFVKPDTPLDKEAFERSTSVYLVDRVLPMLPEKISNNLCSLRPKEDRLCFSAVFEFDKDFKIVSRWFGKGVIYSDRRFTYEEAQEVLDAGEGEFAAELLQLNKIAKKLRKDKFKNGAIAFDSEEVQFKLDETGKPIGVYVKERKDAHLLIEDFMLLANKEVAQFIAEKGKSNEIPFVYRVHDEPNPDKVEEFARFVHGLGIEFNTKTPKDVGRSINQMVKALEKEPGLKFLEPLAIRTMAKAAYSSNNIGHYGLGFEYYTHFTSPIRRYSDVLSHRILEQNIPKEEYFRVNKTKLEERCEHISLQERKAIEAERESVKYKQAEYIEQFVGHVLPGVVNGLIDKGMFVALVESRAEGLVNFSTLDEPFEIMEGRLKARGIDSGLEITIGDEIWVQIVSVDLTRREIDMAIADAPEEAS